MSKTDALEREAEETEAPAEAPAAPEAPATDAGVQLSASEKDAVVRTAAAEGEKAVVDAPGSLAGESRAWNDQASVD